MDDRGYKDGDDKTEGDRGRVGRGRRGAVGESRDESRTWTSVFSIISQKDNNQ